MTPSSHLTLSTLLTSLHTARQESKQPQDVTMLRMALEEAYRCKAPPSLLVGESSETADWVTPVIENASQLLAEGQWELEVIAMLTVAWVDRYGLVGLHAGLCLLYQGLQDHWDDLLLQDDNEETTQEVCGQQFAWLHDELSDVIPAVVTDAATTVTTAEWTVLCEELLTVCGHLSQAIVARCGKEWPLLPSLTTTLQRSIPRRTDVTVSPPIRASATSTSHLPVPEHANGVAMPWEPHNREEALQILRNLAAYFRRTEPLGPLANLLDVAVGWGCMTFAEWLPEVLRDPRMLEERSEVLGLLVAGAMKRSAEAL